MMTSWLESKGRSCKATRYAPSTWLFKNGCKHLLGDCIHTAMVAPHNAHEGGGVLGEQATLGV